MARTVVEAGGGVLWRPTPGGQAEIALVHRPKYDDWSVPKGKLLPGEHVLLGAVREVAEETGLRGVPGPPLGSIEYVKDGAPKRVRYWSMQLDSGVFAPNAEVDQLMWLPPREGMLHLHELRDRPVVARFAQLSRPTRPVILVRHASAGDRAAWQGADEDRPLDAVGRRQSEALAGLLRSFDVGQVYSADVLRCIDTVGPLSAQLSLPVSSEPLLSESGVSAAPEASLARLLDISGRPRTPVVCTQRQVLATLLPLLVRRLAGRQAPPPAVAKGGLVVLHLGAEDGHLVALDVLDAPPGAGDSSGCGPHAGP